MKFSILVPTCNRPNLLRSTLTSLVNLNHQDYEIIISDNNSTIETRNIVEEFSHSRKIQYHYHDKRMGLCDHWDWMSRQGTGEFVIICCDDDGVDINILNILEETIKKQNSCLLSWKVGLFYHEDWPDAEFKNHILCQGIPSFTCQRVDIKGLISRYANFDRNLFPESTRFCYSRELGEKVRSLTGRLFWPLAIDLTTPLLMLNQLDNGQYHFLDWYLGFGGRSSDSNAAGYDKSVNERSQNKRANEFFDEHNSDMYPYHPLKVKAYHNGHFQSISLAKHFYPRNAQSLNCNMEEFLFLTRSEMLELKSVNHIFKFDQWIEFETFMLQCSDNVHQKANHRLSKFVKALLQRGEVTQERLQLNFNKVKLAFDKAGGLKFPNKNLDILNDAIFNSEKLTISRSLEIPKTPNLILKYFPDPFNLSKNLNLINKEYKTLSNLANLDFCK